MRTELKNGLSVKHTLTVYAIISLLLGVASIFIGEIATVLSSAFLAGLMIFDTTPRRALSASVSGVIIILNVAHIIFSDTLSLAGFTTVAAALVIALCFLLHRSKTECAFILTVMFAIFTAVTAVLMIMIKLDSFSFEAVAEFVGELYESLKLGFTDYIGEITSDLGNGTADVLLATEDVALVFDTFANLLIAILVVSSFLLAGVTLKIFSFTSARRAKDPDSIIDWKFFVPSIYGYFYVILYIASLFMSDLTVFSVAVLNIYYIFMFVFAYQGYRFVTALISSRRSPIFANFIVIVALLLLSSFAVELLSFVGVFVSVTAKGRGGQNTEN